MFACFQEASRIRKEADDTKRRAVDLKDDADSLSDDVTDTEDQINNLNVQADGDSDLATEVTYGPHRDKTCLRNFRQSEIETSLLSYRD